MATEQDSFAALCQTGGLPWWVTGCKCLGGLVQATFPPCQCKRRNEKDRYSERLRTAQEALMSVIVKVHHLAKHREWYSSFKLFPFLPTPRPTPLDLRPFPQCKQHEVRDGCDKSAEDPDAEGLRKAAADATGAFAAATTQRGSGREPKKMSRTRAEEAEQEGGAALERCLGTHKVYCKIEHLNTGEPLRVRMHARGSPAD